jgi:hypothetical protein
VSNPVAAQTQITIPKAVFAFTPTGFTAVDVEIGTISGLSQLQINFTGGRFASAFSFNEGQVFAASFGGDEVFSLFASPNSSGGQLVGGGNGNDSTSGNLGAGGSNAGSSPSTPPPATTPITPLNPSTGAARGSSNGPPVIVIAQQLSLITVHLAASAAPLTTLPISSLVAGLDNLPSSLTHFGQDDVTAWRRPLFTSVKADDPLASFIDYVEPYRPVAPDAAPAGQPARRGDDALAPVGARIRLLPAAGELFVAPVLELSTQALTHRTSQDPSSRANDRSDRADYSWNLSTVFGAVVVAAGGYHLVLRESDRFGGRAVPRWVGAERPSRRRPWFRSH